MTMRRVVLVIALVLAVSACKEVERKAPGSSDRKKKESRPAAAETANGAAVGAMMPEYSAMWLDGSKFELSKHRDKVVLLNLWATWCGPCRFEIPELEKLHAHYAPRGFEVIGVSVDESGVDAVKSFVADHKMTYPVALDAEGKLAGILQTSMLPTSVLIDRTGKIVWRSVGLVEEKDQTLKKAIESAL